MKTKNVVPVIILAIMLIIPFVNFSQTQGWSEVTTYGGAREEYAYNMCCDANGNIYMVGEYRTSPLILGHDTLTNSFITSTNAFIVKIDTGGKVVWARSAYGDQDDRAIRVRVDGNGNVYVVGNFNSDSITFDKGATWHRNLGWHDLFIVKYSSNGDVLWSKTSGGKSEDFYTEDFITPEGILMNKGAGIAVDNNNNLILTGAVASDTSYFDSVTIIKPVNCVYMILVAKYSPNGKLIWVKKYGADHDNEGLSAACDNSGNIYVTGFFEDPNLDLGGSNILNNNGMFDEFLLKLNSNGGLVWAKNSGGQMKDDGEAIAVDGAGNIYVTGEYASDNISFGAYTVSNFHQASNSNDIFVAKYSSDGTAQWAKTVGGLNDDYVNEMFVDASDNVYIVGNYYSNPMVAGTKNCYNSDVSTRTPELYMVQLNSSGIVNFAARGTGLSDDNCTGVLVCQSTAFGCGYFKSSPMHFTHITTTNHGLYDFFFAKIGWVTSIDNNINQDNNLVVYPNPSNEGNFNIRYNNSTQEKLKIIVYDCLGNIMLNTTSFCKDNNNLQIKLENATPGIYLMEILNEEGQKSVARLIVN